jgi:hypothetical protein
MNTSPLNKLVDCAKAIEGGNLKDADLLLKEIIASNCWESRPVMF